jgi:F-type H+-transporting ATPase subunit alpha
MSVEQEVMVIYAGTKGFLDDVPVNRIEDFQAKFLAYVDSSAPDLRRGLAEKRDLTEELENKLKQTLGDFKQRAWK